MKYRGQDSLLVIYYKEKAYSTYSWKKFSQRRHANDIIKSAIYIPLCGSPVSIFASYRKHWLHFKGGQIGCIYLHWYSGE